MHCHVDTVAALLCFQRFFDSNLFFRIYLGVIETVQRALVPEYVESNLRGTAYAVYYLTVGAAFFVSNALFGTLWECFGSPIASAYSIVMTTVSIVLMVVFLSRVKRRI